MKKYCKYCGRLLKSSQSIKNGCGSWCKKQNELKYKNIVKLSKWLSKN